MNFRLFFRNRNKKMINEIGLLLYFYYKLYLQINLLIYLLIFYLILKNVIKNNYYNSMYSLKKIIQ